MLGILGAWLKQQRDPDGMWKVDYGFNLQLLQLTYLQVFPFSAKQPLEVYWLLSQQNSLHLRLKRIGSAKNGWSVRFRAHAFSKMCSKWFKIESPRNPCWRHVRYSSETRPTVWITRRSAPFDFMMMPCASLELPAYFFQSTVAITWVSFKIGWYLLNCLFMDK